MAEERNKEKLKELALSGDFESIESQQHLGSKRIKQAIKYVNSKIPSLKSELKAGVSSQSKLQTPFMLNLVKEHDTNSVDLDIESLGKEFNKINKKAQVNIPHGTKDSVKNLENEFEGESEKTAGKKKVTIATLDDKDNTVKADLKSTTGAQKQVSKQPKEVKARETKQKKSNKDVKKRSEKKKEGNEEKEEDTYEDVHDDDDAEDKATSSGDDDFEDEACSKSEKNRKKPKKEEITAKAGGKTKPENSTTTKGKKSKKDDKNTDEVDSCTGDESEDNKKKAKKPPKAATKAPTAGAKAPKKKKGESDDEHDDGDEEMAVSDGDEDGKSGASKKKKPAANKGKVETAKAGAKRAPPPEQVSKAKRQYRSAKKADVSPSDELFDTKWVPLEEVCFADHDVQLRRGLEVAIIIGAYREFMDALPSNILVEEKSEFSSVLASPDTVLFGQIQDFSQAVTLNNNEDFVQINVSVQGQSHQLLYVPLSSTWCSDIFVMSKAKFDKSLAARFLVKNGQVKRLFQEADGSQCYTEGMIYDIRENCITDPFHSIHVVDLRREEGSLNWLFDYDQAFPVCSPWDLHKSSFVGRMLPPADIAKTVSCEPMAVIDYLQGIDAAYVFEGLDKAYMSFFPLKEDQLDLPTIKKRYDRGLYNEKTSKGDSVQEGMKKLFADLHKMVANSKALNEENRDTQIWLCADIVEKELYHLQRLLGGLV